MGAIERLQDAIAAKKRDVQGMGQLLADLDAEAPVRLLFVEDRYGHFEYVGVPTVLGDGSRVLAGRPFDNAAGKPSSSLRAVDVGELADDEGEVVEGAALRHGDLATATFSHGLYGEFAVTGIALQDPDGTRTLIGEWIVADADAAAPRLVEARRIAAEGTHDLPVPARLGHIETAVA